MIRNAKVGDLVQLSYSGEAPLFQGQVFVVTEKDTAYRKPSYRINPVPPIVPALRGASSFWMWASEMIRVRRCKQERKPR